MGLDKRHIMTAGIEKKVLELRPALRYSQSSINIIDRPVGLEVFQAIYDALPSRVKNDFFLSTRRDWAPAARAVTT
jgi:hypothetical protein